MLSSTSSFDRTIPNVEWRSVVVWVAAIVAMCTAGWEVYCRSLGYRPTLNDNSDLWAIRRASVTADSLVVVGSSRALFDTDLTTLESVLGQRPIQLSLVGSSAYPVLADLAADTSFRGTVVAEIVPLLYFAPAGPPLENSLKALRRYRTQTIAQRFSEYLGIFLESNVAFLKQEDLTFGALLERINLPNREGALVPPRLPPYFYRLDMERRATMVEEASIPGPLQTRVMEGWPPLFTPPPPPNWVPLEAFQKQMGELVEARFQDTVEAVRKIRSRGGRVIFVRYPVSGRLKEIEDSASPRSGLWTRLLRDTQAPGIYFEDFPELAGFTCPEWSHLSAGDSVEFTRRLAPLLKSALAAP